MNQQFSLSVVENLGDSKLWTIGCFKTVKQMVLVSHISRGHWWERVMDWKVVKIWVVPLGSMGRYLGTPLFTSLGKKTNEKHTKSLVILNYIKLISCIFLAVGYKKVYQLFTNYLQTNGGFLGHDPSVPSSSLAERMLASGPLSRGAVLTSNVTSNVSQPSNSGQINYKIFFAQKISLFLYPAHFFGDIFGAVWKYCHSHFTDFPMKF